MSRDLCPHLFQALTEASTVALSNDSEPDNSLSQAMLSVTAKRTLGMGTVSLGKGLRSFTASQKIKTQERKQGMI